MPRGLPALFCLITLLVPLGSFAAERLSSRQLDRIPLHIVAPGDVERVRRSIPADPEHGPVLIALNVPSSLDLSAGQWTSEGGVSVWRLRLYSQQARLLIPSFSRFDLPTGAELRVMSVDGSQVQGPYTRADRSRDGGLTTALVTGDQALLELRVPTSSRSQVHLALASLGHGIRSLAGDEPLPKSGTCNRDVLCTEGDGWRDQIRSVVRLQITRVSGTFACTGELVNNISQDKTPYVLTANHCGITSSNADRVVVYYNFLTSACGGTPNGSLAQNQTGSIFRFSHAPSDHTLIELEARPRSSFNVFYAGFDATPNQVPSGGRVIHHPGGDEKRISVVDGVRRTTTNIAGIGNSLLVYGVTFSAGVTEAGSSGSGLFNQDQAVVGVLSGGSTSCTSPNAEDFFGRTEVAWTAGLSNWLDPASTGRTSICGTNATGSCDTGGGGFANESSGGGGGAFSSGFLLVLAGLWSCLRRVRRI